MSSLRRSELNARLTPLKLALAAAVVAYLLRAVVARQLSPPGVTTPLLSISALVIAFVSIVAAYTALSMVFGPPIGRSAIRTAENRASARAMIVAARKEADDTIARTSPWGHYLSATLGGITYGLLLARGITWFLG